jgi:hypothetical protein
VTRTGGEFAPPRKTPGITAALWGAHPEELEAVASAQDWKLDPDALAAIDQILGQTIASPVGPEFMAPPARSAVAAQATRHRRSN